MSPPGDLLDQMVERGALPDPLLRAGIRRLLRRRLVEERAGGVEAIAARYRARREAWLAGPIAIETAAANGQRYEGPAAFYAEVLGPRRKYSACLFPGGGETLAEAELRMLELTAERARLLDGQRVLDLGCGWGAFTLWAAERYRSSHILALSNSSSQRDYIVGEARARGLRNVEVVTADINDFAPANSRAAAFDRVVSIEGPDHVRNHGRLFERIARWLRPDGLLFAQVFAHRELTYPFDPRGPSDWMSRRLFSGGIMPSVPHLASFQDHLRLEEQWLISGSHYARTCEAWLANLDQHRGAALAALSKTESPTEARRSLHRWRTFLLACAETFAWSGGDEWLVAHYAFSPRRAADEIGDDDPLAPTPAADELDAFETAPLQVAQHRSPCQQVLIRCALFNGVSDADLSELEKRCTAHRYRRGQVLLEEGALDMRLVMVGSGRVEVKKSTRDSAGERLTTLGPGAALGELKLIDPEPNSATVVALDEVEAWSIDLEELNHAPALRTARTVARMAAARLAVDRMRRTSNTAAEALHAELKEARHREAAGRFIVNLFVAICAYFLIVSAMQLLPVAVRPSAIVLTPALGLINSIPIVRMLRSSWFARRSLGLTLRGWRRDTLYAVLYTLPACAVITLFKWIWIHFDPRLAGGPLFHADRGALSPAMFVVAALIYSATCPVQEFAARSGLQALLEQLVPSKKRGADWTAIGVSNLIFASAHTHIGFPFAVAAFVPGLFWGWLFSRHRSLIAVSVSHALLGVFALFVLGIQPIIGGR